LPRSGFTATSPLYRLRWFCLIQEGYPIAATEFTGKTAYLLKVTAIGLVINVLLSAFKFLAGYYGRSQALIADSIHSLSDTTTDVALLIGVHYWSQPPDENHPYGHQRLETLVTVFIALVLIGAAVAIGWEAMRSLHVEHSEPPGLIAVVAAALSILIKETLYRWTAAAGRHVKSPALAANAWHHRTDAVSSLPVLVAVGGSLVFPSWSFLDHVGAVVVSIFILHAASGIIWPALRELVDSGAPSEIRKAINDIARQNSGVEQVHGIRTRYVSSSIQVDLHIVVDGALAVREGHEIAEDVRKRIIQDIEQVVDVIIHVDPSEAALPEEELH
jgi:cation diffusion facilitator family transporter